jgi:pimeloyl-ACP methyl ester carboxylesterase
METHMTATAFAQPQNSTTVRSNTIGVAEAARRFGEPPAPTAPRVPDVPDATTERITLQVGVAMRELAVYRWRQGAGHPVALLAHGFGGSAAQLVGFVPGLLAAGFNVIAFDQPAHGFSPGRYAHLVEFSRNISAVARAFDARVVIAHSLGATATLLAHARGLPLERAVLIAPPGNVEHFATAFADHVGLPREQRPAMLTQVERDLGYPLHLLDVRNVLSIAEGAPAQLLVMHDPADAEVPYAHARHLIERWPSARLQPLSGVGHLRVLRDDAAIADAIAHIAQVA